MKRPGIGQWLGYAFGRGLPPDCAEWVLHDTTCSTWIVRHLARVLVMLAVPIVVLVVVLPTGAGLKALTAFVTGACVVLLTAILSSDMTERRLQKAGYEWGTGESVRARRSVTSQTEANRRRRERLAARRGRPIR